MNTNQVVAVIGLGSMGQRYVSHFRSQKKTTVVGCDVRRETFPDGIVCAETVSELLDATVPDVAVIASPAEHHLETLFALQANHSSCSVLMEKPISNRRLTESDFQQCQSLMDSTIAVGYCWRFHPYTRQLHSVRHAIRDITLFSGQDMRTWPGQHYADPLREFSHELDLVSYLTSTHRIEDVSFTPQGIYQIDGTHSRGRWSVRIAPFQSQPERWINTVMEDDGAFTYHWDVRPRIIELMYQSQASQVMHATGPEGLFCPLRDGIQTTLLVDEIESRLDVKHKTWKVM